MKRDNREAISLPAQIVLIAGVLLAAWIAFTWSDTADSAENPGGWPVRLEYSIDQFDGEEPVRLALTASGWDSWRQVTECCGPDTGFIVEYRPDSSFWTGGLPGLPLTQDFVHDGGDGMAPVPDLAPRWPTDPLELAKDPHVTVLDLSSAQQVADVDATAMADRLDLDLGHLVFYVVARDVLSDGRQAEVTNTRLVYTPMNLTLYDETNVDGRNTRIFRVETLEFLSDDFSIPFGETAE
jgi:hypothetical protein